MNTIRHLTWPALSRGLAALAATLLTLVLLASNAFASATGTSGFGPNISYHGYGGHMGTYWAMISGSGNSVSYVKGWPQLMTPVGNICNWNITAEFFDTKGKWYKTYSGPVHKTCNSYWNQARADIIRINKTMKTGKMCSTLKSNGSRLTSVCHSIHP